jgi:hypothetical protein
MPRPSLSTESTRRARAAAYDAAVLTRTIAIAAALALVLVACKKEEPTAPPAAKDQPADAAPKATPPDAAPPPDATPALPTDPKELAELRNKAILDGRYDIALTICNAEDVPKIGELDIMSCVLAACQRSDVEKAQAWSKLLKGEAKKQSKKICAANKVPI